MTNEQHLRRIGVIGDIHSEDRNLQSALEYLAECDLDMVMAVGDVADGRGSVDRCCQLLQQYHVVTVRGNHDRWFLAGEARNLPDATYTEEVSCETHAFLSSLPTTLDYETLIGRLLLCHGLGEYDMGGVRPGDYGYALEANFALLRLMLEAQHRFVVNGHTHQRMVRNFDHLTIINAGTLFREHQPCFMVADFGSKFVQYYDLQMDGQISESDRWMLPAN